MVIMPCKIPPALLARSLLPAPAPAAPLLPRFGKGVTLYPTSSLPLQQHHRLLAPIQPAADPSIGV